MRAAGILIPRCGRLQRFGLFSAAGTYKPGGLAAWLRLCPQDPEKSLSVPQHLSPEPGPPHPRPALPAVAGGCHHLHLKALGDVGGWMSRITAHVPLASNKQLTFWR